MWRIAQGVTQGRSWPLADVSGNPITDFTGWTAAAQIRDVENDELLFDFGIDGDIELAGSAVTLSLDAADSAGWAWRLGLYDVKVADGSGRTALVARGRVMVIPAVTR
jgi:hypothetical protein